MKRRPTPYWPSFHGAQGASSTQGAAPIQDVPKSQERYAERALRYISGYPVTVQNQARNLVERKALGDYLIDRYPAPHDINSNKLLRAYTLELKSTHLRSSERLSKVCFDDKLHLVHHALGTQSFISLPHGGRLKTRRELRVSSLFKRCPEPLLRMIVVHELAHLREREHNDAFYRLCVHMEGRYHQLELDARLYLIHKELFGDLYQAEES